MKVPAPFPFKGRSDGAAKARQEPLTTRDCVNVRGYLDATGRYQGGQRAGLSPELGGGNQPVNAEGVPVQWLSSVSYDNPAYTYAQLGNPAAGGAAGEITDEWADVAPSGDESYDVEMDGRGNGYFLSANGTITKRNGDGVEVWSFTLPLPSGAQVCHRLRVDSLGAVYAASYQLGQDEGVRVYRVVPRDVDDAEGAELAWTKVLEGEEVTDILLLAGSVLYLAINDQEVEATARVATLEALAGDDPVEGKLADVPRPVRRLAFSRGKVLFACPPFPRRAGTLGGDIAVSEIDWTPNDLASAEERLHAWYSAFGLDGYGNGQQVTVWPDIRAAEAAAAGASTPLDATNRDLVRVSYYNPGPPEYGGVPPRYFTSALATLPGVRFSAAEGVAQPGSNIAPYDKGSALQARWPADAAIGAYHKDKINTSDTLPAATGLWPGVSESQHFAITMLVQVPNDGKQVLWSVGVNPNQTGAPSRWLAITVGDKGDGVYPLLGLTGITRTIATNEVMGVSLYGTVGATTPGGAAADVASTIFNGSGSYVAHVTAAVPTGGADLRLALITLVCDGAGAVRLRVNGVQATGYTIQPELIDVFKPEVLGNRVYGVNTGNAVTEEWSAAFLQGFSSFTGTVFEAISYFADSSASSSPHDRAWGTGSPTFEDDVESVEGYVAWKWGVAASTLPASHAYTSAAPSSGAGTFYDPVDQTSAAAALRSNDGILGMISPTSGVVLDAIEGAGIGWGLEADPRLDAVYSTGPRLAPASVPGELGPRANVTRRILDRGTYFDWQEPARGMITLTAVPADTETFTISDGTTSTDYEFGPSLTTGDVLIDNTTGSPNLDTIAARIEAAVTGASGQADIFAERNSAIDNLATGEPVEIRFWNRKTTAVAATAITTTTTDVQVIYGMTAGAAPTGAWNVSATYANRPTNEWQRLAIDYEGDVYLPQALDTKANHVVKRDKDDGTELFTYDVGGSPGVFDVYAVACSRAEFDWTPSVATGPEFLWIANSNVTASLEPDLATQRKARLVSKTPKTDTPRTTESLAVSGGKLYRVPKGGTASLVGVVSTDTDSPWVTATEAFGRVWFVDNGTYKQYSPRKGVIEAWEADGSGQIPKGCKLTAAYRGRLVLGRNDEDPFRFWASAQGDPEDWDITPVVDTVTKAYTARIEDTITALVPFYNDVLVVGGQNSLQQFTGDLSEIGSVGNSTKATGMAWDAWCVSPQGLLYFWGSQGGIWVVDPRTNWATNPPREITRNRVPKAFDSMNPGQYRARLVWNHAEDGMHVFFTRLQAATTSVDWQHWYYDRQADAWWPDKFGAGSRIPYSVAWMDNDLPGARGLVLGCEDGRLRRWDAAATSDDGFAIASHVLLGPFTGDDKGFELKATALWMQLADNHAGARYELYVGDNPNKLGNPVESGYVTTDFNGRKAVRARGGYVWLRLENTATFEKWALETAALDLSRGRKRTVRQ